MSKENHGLDKTKQTFKEAVKIIDEEFGKGYSSKNPDLVKHFMNTALAEDQLELSRQATFN